MSEVINHILRQEEERETRATSDYECFKDDAVSRLSECLLHIGDIHELIEELASEYWDIFFSDLEDSDINLFITLAVAHNIRSVS